MPCSLYDAVSRLTKDEMDQIRKNYVFKGLSTLKKDELAAELARAIPLLIEQVIYTLDQRRYELIQRVIRHSGVMVMAEGELSPSQIEALMSYGLLFPGMYEGEKVLVMPDELIESFSQVDGSELKTAVRRNTEWIRLSHGLLHYYGVMTPALMMKQMEKLTGGEVDFFAFTDVMLFACDFYGQARMTSYGYQDDTLFDAMKLMEEQSMRPNVDYYPFNREQLLKASDPDYVDQTAEMHGFFRFLSNDHHLTSEEKNEIARQMTHLIRSGTDLSLITQYLLSMLEPPSFEFAQQLTEKIAELYNHTRQWALKGHTPSDLFHEERKYLRPLPNQPFKASQSNAQSGPQARTKTKVGRNDPCPCGSGKKYKKCCGR